MQNTAAAKKGTLITERQAKSRTKRRGRHHDEEPIFKTKWKGCFGIVICDEGHHIRHVHTKIHASMTQLEAKVYWFLTATPIMNTALVGIPLHTNLKLDTDNLYYKDILGGLLILWRQVALALNRDTEAKQGLKDCKAQGFEIFKDLSNLPPDDIRKTIAMDPAR